MDITLYFDPVFIFNYSPQTNKLSKHLIAKHVYCIMNLFYHYQSTLYNEYKPVINQRRNYQTQKLTVWTWTGWRLYFYIRPEKLREKLVIMVFNDVKS